MRKVKVGNVPGQKKAFTIDFDNIGWLEGLEDDQGDYCAHAHAVARIGEESFEYNTTVSATALYLLKSLTEDHRAYYEEQFLPCCGFNIFEKNDGTGDVVVLGCPNGIDWDLVHREGMVMITTDSGAETAVPFDEYRDEVIRFADKVEAFYDSQPPRRPSKDDAAAYRAFWEEWHRRRREA